MTNLKTIHSFAERYKKLYSDPNTHERDVDVDFAKQCFELGFQMDCGDAFMEAFSRDAFYSSDALISVIDRVDDVDLLGSAIFSRWRYVTHWGQSDITEEANRFWFVTAFSRLAEITGR